MFFGQNGAHNPLSHMELSLSHRLFNSSSSLPSLFNSRIKLSQTHLFSLNNHHQKLQFFTGLHHKLAASMEPQTTIPHAFDNGSSITSSETGKSIFSTQ